MDSIKIAPLSNPSSDEEVDLLARAFITTPMHAAAFGGSGEKELQLGRGNCGVQPTKSCTPMTGVHKSLTPS